MTKQEILSEVEYGNFQPEFEFTNDLDTVVNSILKPHEDYFLGLHSKVKEIIEREIERTKTIVNSFSALSMIKSIEFANPDDKYHCGEGIVIQGKSNFIEYIKDKLPDDHTIEDAVNSNYLPFLLEGYYEITFADVCNWQKELFEHKKNIAYGKISLPNLHINLGLRTTNVKVNEWNPPTPMFLEDLKEMCFPIYFEIIDEFNLKVKLGSEWFYFTKKTSHIMIKRRLTEWYKTFQIIHFFEDLNGRLGEIIINILFYALTNKLLIRYKNYF